MLLISNRRARFDYEIVSTIQAGAVLTGPEVKSLRAKAGSLTGSYVQIVAGEAVLLGAQISPYPQADNRDYDPKRTRKLLLKKSEIYRLQAQIKQKHFTLVPLSWQLVGKRLKLEIGVGRGRQQFEKRQHLQEREWKRTQKNLGNW